MKKEIYIYVLLTTLFSCSNTQENKLTKLAGIDHKYWLIEEEHPYVNTIYYFNRKGKWLIYEKYLNGPFQKYDGGDVFFIEKWHLSEQGINIGGRDYKILNLTDFKFDIQYDKEIIKMIPANDSLLVSKHKAPNKWIKVRVEKTNPK
jgi:hypothetical protein